MNIRFACYQPVMLIRGGPHVKIIQTKAHLEKLGINVFYFDMWDTAKKILDCDLFHLFSANLGVYSLAKSLKERDVPFVVNPIFFTRRSPFVVRTVCRMDRWTRRVVRGLWWDYGFVRDICAWAERVLPNTAAEGQLIAEGLGIPNEKIEVIPNGVSEAFLHGDPTLFKKKYGIDGFILNVGHIGPGRKNVLSLIRALRRIDHPAVIIGRITSGGESEACLREAEKNKNLILIDGLDHTSPMLASAYAACDVFVLPSTFETPGRAALEAALAGAKIVITPHGGTREYFQEFAEYVDPSSMASIRRGIERALNAPKDLHLRERIRKQYLWDRIAERYAEVIRQG